MIDKKINEGIILLGSNLGDRFMMLSDAVYYLKQSEIEITNQSGIYETAAWGIENQPAFLNQAVKIKTEMGADVLLKRILDIEKIIGRVRDNKWEQRCIDIDILFF